MPFDDLRSLYPALSDEALAEADENINRYLLLAWDIAESQSTAAELASNADHLYHPDQGRIEKPESPKL